MAMSAMPQVGRPLPLAVLLAAAGVLVAGEGAWLVRLALCVGLALGVGVAGPRVWANRS